MTNTEWPDKLLENSSYVRARAKEKSPAEGWAWLKVAQPASRGRGFGAN